MCAVAANPQRAADTLRCIIEGKEDESTTGEFCPLLRFELPDCRVIKAGNGLPRNALAPALQMRRPLTRALAMSKPGIARNWERGEAIPLLCSKLQALNPQGNSYSFSGQEISLTTASAKALTPVLMRNDHFFASEVQL